ncbi:MAG: chitobiase/beta-hexosaminidase C-terminal domain-containing protein, partial [Methanobacterium sp.]
GNIATNNGGAIWSYNANGNSRVNFNSITGNSPNNSEIYSGYGTLDATLNWWGLNTNPSVYVGADVGKVNVDPWLILNITASPTSIIAGNNSTVTADLQHDSNGIYHDPVGGQVPDGIPVSFTATNGNIGTESTILINGLATTLFTSKKVGTTNINAKAGGQVVSTQVTVNPISTTVAVDPVHNIAGKNVTLMAHVTDCYGNPVDEGQVDFTVNGITVNADVTDGIATLNWTIPSVWTVNSYDISVKYIETDEYAQSSGKGTLTVDQDPKVDVSIAGGIYNTNISAALTINKPGTVYYTTDGSTPTTSSNVYNSAVNISETTTLKYMAVDTENNASPIYTQTYTIDRTAPTASASVKAGTYNKNLNITLKMSEAGTIYYTTNGAAPTTSSKKYTGAFIINKTTTLKFLAVDKAGNKSPVYTVKYVIDKTRPYVKAMYPTKSKTGISRSNTLYLKFSENIKAGINWSKVYIKNLKTGKKVALSEVIKNNVLYLKTGKRSANTWYQIYIPASAIKDAAGNNGIGYTWKFKTGRY